MRFTAVVLLTLLFVVPAFAAEFSGQVVGVIDGDTMDVLSNGKAKRIRLNGIDCPEKGQAYGKKAKQAASDLAFGKDVIIQTRGKDKYGRTIGEVILEDGTNVNHELVKEGWCWWYRKYAPGNTVLEGLEKNAREAKKGLWVDPAPVPPWVYRKAKRGQSLDLSDLVPLESELENSGTSRAPPQLSVAQPESLLESENSPYPIIGNRRSHIYHRPDCPNYSQVALSNRVEFNSAAEAEAAGYRVAQNCP